MNDTTPTTHRPIRSHLSENDNIDFKRYLALIISNWYWFVITLFITISFAYSINRWSGEIYTVSSTLLIKDEQNGGGITGIEKIIPGGDIFRGQQNLKNEIWILKSDTLSYRSMKELKDFHVVYTGVGKRGIVESRLYKTAPFIVKYDSLEIEPMNVNVRIKIISEEKYHIEINEKTISEDWEFGKRFSKAGFDFILLKNKDYFRFDPGYSNKFMFYFASPDVQASLFRSTLSVQPIEKEASLVILSATGPSSEQIADYLNELMDMYIKQGLETKDKIAIQTIEFIDGQLKYISDSLKKAEGELEKFRTSNKFMDISKEGVVIQNRLEQVQNEKTTIELQKLYYNYLLDYIVTKNKTGELLSPSILGINDQYLINLLNNLAALEKNRGELGFNLDKDLAAVKLLDQGIVETRRLINENIKNSLGQLDLSSNDIQKRLTIIETEVNKLPRTERELITIQRKFDLNNTVYTYLMEKRAEAGIAKASTVSDNRIIDKAKAINASLISPMRRKNYGMALILGLLLPTIAILLIDFLNNKVIDKRDIENLTSVPIIGYISHNVNKTELPFHEKPGSALAESFRSVRTALKYFVKDKGHTVISVTSTISSEGKTFFSINLATSLASLGKKVLLVGLDLRKPRIHKVFNLDNQIGISNYLIGDQTYTDIIQKTEIKNLFYVPSGTIPPNPAELLDSNEMKTFIENVKKEYDYVIFDTPPVAIVTDALLLAPYVNINIFVVRQRYTRRNTINLIEELHQGGNMTNMAIVINDISLSGYYGYGLRYGYSFGYGYTYGYNYYGQYVDYRYGYSDSGKGYYNEDET